MPKKISPAIRDNAKRDFVAGQSIPQIIETYGLKKSTVDRWHKVDNWKEARAEAVKRVEESLYEKVVLKVEQSTDKLLDFARIMSQMCAERALQIYKHKDHISMNDEERAGALDEMYRLARIAKHVSSMQKDVVPTAQEDMSERILDEIEQLKIKLTPLPKAS